MSYFRVLKTFSATLSIFDVRSLRTPLVKFSVNSLLLHAAKLAPFSVTHTYQSKKIPVIMISTRENSFSHISHSCINLSWCNIPYYFEVWISPSIIIFIKLQCRQKTLLVHQTFVWWTWYILYKFGKFPIRHLGLAIGNVWWVRRFLPTLIVNGKWTRQRSISSTKCQKLSFNFLIAVPFGPTSVSQNTIRILHNT